MAVNWLSQGDMVCKDAMSSVSGVNLCHSVNGFECLFVPVRN